MAHSMVKFASKLAVNIVALWIADWALSGLVVAGGWKNYVLAGAVLGLLNALAKPILKLLTLPLIIVTFGIFSLVINALLLWLVGYIFDFVSFAHIGTLVWATGIITLLNVVLTNHND